MSDPEQAGEGSSLGETEHRREHTEVEDDQSEAIAPTAYELLRESKIAARRLKERELLGELYGTGILPDGDSPEIELRRPPPKHVITTDSSPRVTRSQAHKSPRARKGSNPRRHIRKMTLEDYSSSDEDTDVGANPPGMSTAKRTPVKATGRSPDKAIKPRSPHLSSRKFGRPNSSQQQSGWGMPSGAGWNGPQNPGWNYWQQQGPPGYFPGQPYFGGPPGDSTGPWNSMPPWQSVQSPMGPPPAMQNASRMRGTMPQNMTPDAEEDQGDLLPQTSTEEVTTQEWRRLRKLKHRKWKLEVAERTKEGLKPNLIKVNEDGEIREDGRHEWFADLKRCAMDYLDLGVVEYSKQPQARLANMRATLDSKYEYVGGELSDRFVKKKLQTVLKTERDRLKKLWEQDHASALDAPCPQDVDPAAWKSLIAYWDSTEGRAKSQRMKDARSLVVNPNMSGRAGYVGSAKKLKNEGGASPFHKEVAQQVFTPGPKVGSSAVSGQTSKMSAGNYNMRMESLEKSCAQSLDKVEALQANFDNLQKNYSAVEGKLNSHSDILSELLQIVKSIVPPSKAAGSDGPAVNPPIASAPEPSVEHALPVTSDHEAQPLPIPAVSTIPESTIAQPLSVLPASTEVQPSIVLPVATVVKPIPPIDPVATVVTPIPPINPADPAYDPFGLIPIIESSRSPPDMSKTKEAKRSRRRGIWTKNMNDQEGTTTGGSASLSASLTKSLSASVDLAPQEVVSAQATKEQLKAAKANKKSKFAVGDYVVLKKPKNVMVEAAIAKVVAVAGQRVVVGDPSSTITYTVGPTFVGIEIKIVLDAKVELPYPEPRTIPPMYCLADAKDRVIQWSINSLKKARKEDIDQLEL